MNPQATNHSLSWIRRLHNDGTLDLSPRFQRRPVWSDSQSAFLIDSILSRLPIPELFFRTSTSAAGETLFEVVDGQQRLLSIIKFFLDDLELDGKDVSEAWRGYRWSTLSSEQQTSFWSYKIVVRELEEVSDAEVRDMFHRLNANQSSLNDQELRHAQYSGAFTALVEDIADDSWWLTNRIITPAQSKRMLDVEFVSELLVGLMGGPLDKKKGIESYYIDYDDDLPDAEEWKSVFHKTRILAERVVGEDLPRWKSKTEFYSLFLACGRVVYDERVPTGAALASAIRRLKIFRERATIAKRRDSGHDVPQYVRDYAEASTRASTDRARRLYRISVVESLLLGETPQPSI